jgi:hypothetical protein
MINPVNDIVKQASQGSVAAIIQILNEKLADSGVRTRAIFADGVLQLLCEAATVEQLEQSVLVERVRQILETISPRSIRRININGRIAREQQLLWLEEINRDPESQLLWSQQITLKRPNLLQQFVRDWQQRQDEWSKVPMPRRSSHKAREREQEQFWRGLFGGAGLSLFLGAILATYFNWWNIGSATRQVIKTTASTTLPTQSASNNLDSLQPSASQVATRLMPTQEDTFAAAVRIAEQSSQAGVGAKSYAEWLDLAVRWQKASDLMARVQESDSRYTIAQDRVLTYRKNSELALAEAKRQQQPVSPEAVSNTDVQPTAAPEAEQ